MRIIRDNVWLCSDCTFVACNGPHGTDIPENTIAGILGGLKRLGQHLVSNFDSEIGDGLLEFSSLSCDSCKEWRARYRAPFARLRREKGPSAPSNIGQTGFPAVRPICRPT